VVNFFLLGGIERPITHLWVVFGISVIDKVPLMQGVSQISVFVVAVFEKAFYWSIILLIAIIIHIIWQQSSSIRLEQVNSI
jgi:hypothetical protein